MPLSGHRNPANTDAENDAIEFGLAQQRLMGLLLLFMAVTMLIVGQLISLFGFPDRLSELLGEANQHRTLYRTITFALAVTASAGLFLLRKRRRKLYGGIELAVALLALSLFASKSAPNSVGEWVAGFLAPIYIAIRGMDNIDQGSPRESEYGLTRTPSIFVKGRRPRRH